MNALIHPLINTFEQFNTDEHFSTLYVLQNELIRCENTQNDTCIVYKGVHLMLSFRA